jgi:hypothetical protein
MIDDKDEDIALFQSVGFSQPLAIKMWIHRLKWDRIKAGHTDGLSIPPFSPDELQTIHDIKLKAS